MNHKFFPFKIVDSKAVNFPFIISDTSRVRIVLERNNQELIDNVFPKQKFTLTKRGVRFIYPSASKHRLATPYLFVLESNCILSIYRNPINYMESNKFANIIDSLIDSFQLFTCSTLSIHIGQTGDTYEYTASCRNNRGSSNILPEVNLKEHDLISLKKYYPLILVNKDRKILLARELFRNACIDSKNSYGLKCSLLVIIIESFILVGFKSKKENFGMRLSRYMNDDRESIYSKLYINRSKYLHTGSNDFETNDWELLHSIVKSILIDYLEDKKIIKLKCESNGD